MHRNGRDSLKISNYKYLGCADYARLRCFRAGCETMVTAIKGKGGKEGPVEEANSALFRAVEKRDLKGVEEAIESGADPNAKRKDDVTPLMYAASYSDCPEIVELLIKKGADVNARESQFGMTPLMFAAAYGTPEVLKMLIKNGANVNDADNAGRTPLMYAAVYGKESNVKVLVENGAKVDARDNDNATAELYATLYGKKQIAEFLKQKKAESSPLDAL